MLIPGIQIDQDSSVPVYRQIADGIRQAALEGRLKPGRRLPPTRDLARQLGINRQTVVSAYEALASEGWVESHTGRGTFLVHAGESRSAVDPAPVPDDAGSWMAGFSRAVEGPNVGGLLSVYITATSTDGISFAGSYPAREMLPTEPFAAAMARAFRDEGESALVYGPIAGHLPLRELIAERASASEARIGANDILITNGAQQALELVFHTFLERGDAVVIEEPTYTGALSVLASIGARAIAVPVDEQGMRPDLLAIALERHRPRVMYVQPTFHNPTTGVMGEARRRQLLALAARNRCMVVEDDWASDLRFEGRTLPTLHELDGGAHVIHLQTFSKKLLPGLRLGWVTAPPSVMERLIALKQIRDCGTSPLLQAALYAFLRDGGLEEHLARSLPAIRERRDCMLQALEKHFPAEAAWTRPRGGLFLWVTLPRTIDVRGLSQAAAERGVLYSKGELFHSNADGRHTLRLSYSTAKPSQIETGVATLGALIRDFTSDHGEPPGRPTVETVPIL